MTSNAGGAFGGSGEVNDSAPRESGSAPPGASQRGTSQERGAPELAERASGSADLARLTEPDLSATERHRALAGIVTALRARGGGWLNTNRLKVSWNPRAAAAWLADAVVDLAPRVPIRTADTLRSHFPAMSDEQIAQRLIRNAGRASAGIGAVGGGVSSVSWAAPPTLLTAPVLLAAETVAVVAVELKLIGELQAVYGAPVPEGVAERAAALISAWAGRRGVNVLAPGRALAVVLASSTRNELRDRLLRRFGRNLTTLGPLLTGAAVASWLNRRGTLRLAEQVRADLLASEHS